MKKILSILFVGILVLSGVGGSVISTGIPSLHPSIKVEKNWKFKINYGDNSSRVLIELDINGIRYRGLLRAGR